MSNDTQPRFLIAPDFRKEHEQALTLYLQDDRRLSTEQWQLLYEAIEQLDQSEVVVAGKRFIVSIGGKVLPVVMRSKWRSNAIWKRVGLSLLCMMFAAVLNVTHKLI